MFPRTFLAATLACLAGAAAAQTDPMAERVKALFGMDRQSFERELEKRFQYAPPPPPAAVDDEREGRIADAVYFLAFPDYDRAYPPEARLHAMRLAKALVEDAGSLSHEAFVLRVAEIAALAENAHTSIGENALRKNTPRLKLRTFLFADGLYIVRAAPEHSALLGVRVETIEGRTVDNVFARLARYLPGPEARRRLQLLPVLESPALLHAAGLAPARDSLSLGIRLQSGKRVDVRLEAEERGPAAPVMNTVRLLYPAGPSDAFPGLPLPEAEAPTYLRHRTQLFTTADLPAGGFYIGLTHNNDSDDRPLGEFLESALDEVAAGKPSFVVVDMRMNGGGDYTKSYAFARALPAVASGAAIYVLTSPWTFSAAITTVAALKDAGNGQVKIVGEPVGDALAFWAEGGTFELPNSGIQVHYAAGRHDYQQPCTDPQSCFWLNELFPVRVASLQPDIPVSLSFADWRAGRDPAIEAILAVEGRFGERGQGAFQQQFRARKLLI